jgi:Zn finger protein HypA/HybF involved in hydrogenase expression
MPAAEARAQLKCGACRFAFHVCIDYVDREEVPAIFCPRCQHACSTLSVQALLKITRTVAERLATTKPTTNKETT